MSFGFKEIQKHAGPKYDKDVLLEQCRRQQILTDRQYEHIKAAMTDRHAQVTYQRTDQGMRWTVVYDIES